MSVYFILVRNFTFRAFTKWLTNYNPTGRDFFKSYSRKTIWLIFDHWFHPLDMFSRRVKKEYVSDIFIFSYKLIKFHLNQRGISENFSFQVSIVSNHFLFFHRLHSPVLTELFFIASTKKSFSQRKSLFAYMQTEIYSIQPNFFSVY